MVAAAVALAQKLDIAINSNRADTQALVKAIVCALDITRMLDTQRASAPLIANRLGYSLDRGAVLDSGPAEQISKISLVLSR